MDIPVVDLLKVNDPTFGAYRTWRAAVTDVGAFGLVGHGVPEKVRDECVHAARRFHGSGASLKEACAIEGSLGNKGYVPDDMTPAPSRCGGVLRDYASMDVGSEAVPIATDLEAILLGPNRWPQDPGFKAAVEAYRLAIDETARRVSELFSTLCGLEPDHLRRRSERGCSLLRLLHYPKPAEADVSAIDGHTDYEWFTLIWQSAPGLEILGRDGRTYSAPDRPDVLTVLVGDMLEVLSGGLVESTLHWVRPRTGDRISLTYFYGPDFDEVIAPEAPHRPAEGMQYPELHAGRHLSALRVRHFRHLRDAVTDGRLVLPLDLPLSNPLKTVKQERLARVLRERVP